MSEEARISTREAAERLHVHARTIRKWIDVFEEYISPQVNDRGHYMLTSDGFQKLSDIQQRLQETNKSMRQIRQDLIKEGKWEMERPIDETDTKETNHENLSVPHMNEYPVYRLVGSIDEIGEMMEAVFTRLDQLEDHVFTMFDMVEEMENRLIATQQNMLPVATVQHMMEDIGKKQDQLKAELRNATFSHRLASATSQTQPLTPRRQKRTRFLGIF
ncbi:MerR family transcriptional regulator [Melghirimyces algeriensis]|uniref:MerR HTH family regulatory protein n=1 Tax=Melghirimyces algeriensis TaxID=910412 RepID=A0A521EI98_9BACL|nr:MerR family transcriptional regulator [Melghirimyces algeriensis]SMO83647.1 MerR HTH family regulatory protein [Melghirimyces algeriensis]